MKFRRQRRQGICYMIKLTGKNAESNRSHVVSNWFVSFQANGKHLYCYSVSQDADNCHIYKLRNRVSSCSTTVTR